MISKNFEPWRWKEHYYNLLPYGGKVDVEDIVYDTGGGATNAAVTFARQGLKTACIAKVGVDSAGREVVHVLREEKVSLNHFVKTTKHHTGFSVLIKPANGDRTVMVHRGASFEYHKTDFSLNSLKTQWLYVTSLAGNLDILKMLIDWANKNEVYIAVDPGSLEIKQRSTLLKLLRRCSLVHMNLDEAQALTGRTGAGATVGALHKAGVHTALLTRGGEGSYCLHGTDVYQSGLYKKVRVVDRTGAGDAYTSGFVAALVRGKSIEEAMSFAAANSTSVVGYVGSKSGILRTHDFRALKIRKVKL